MAGAAPAFAGAVAAPGVVPVAPVVPVLPDVPAVPVVPRPPPVVEVAPVPVPVPDGVSPPVVPPPPVAEPPSAESVPATGTAAVPAVADPEPGSVLPVVPPVVPPPVTGRAVWLPGSAPSCAATWVAAAFARATWSDDRPRKPGASRPGPLPYTWPAPWVARWRKVETAVALASGTPEVGTIAYCTVVSG